MPNAREAHSVANHRILALGDTGAGKTTQFLTLPGRKFAYLFDANALLTLRGHDIEYQEFLPDQINLAVKSLAKGKGDPSRYASDLYLQWETDFDAKLESGFFDNFDVIGMDSATTLLDLIMDRVLTINNRAGQWPQQDDYGPQMLTFTSICRTLVGLGKTIYLTGHYDIKQDNLTQRIFRRPMMTGRLQQKIPLLFSDVLAFEAQNDGQGKINYVMQTVPDKMTPGIRTAIRGLEPFEDITVDWDQPPEGQGLGGIINWEAKQAKEK